MKNPTHLNANTEAIPEMNQVVPEPNQVVDIHDPNEMVDIPDDVDLVDYDGDDEENRKKTGRRPKKEPEPNNGLVNQFAPHVDPHQPGVMIGWLEENDSVNEGVNNEDIEAKWRDPSSAHDSSYIGGLAPWALRQPGNATSRRKYVEAEMKIGDTTYGHDDVERRLPCNLMGGNKSSDSVSSDSESEEKEADVAPEDTFGLLPKGLMLFATFRGVYLRVTKAELGTCQTEIALLKSKNKIGGKEREMPNHDLGNIEHVLGDVLERLKVLESRENATSKKKLVEAEMKL
ncbi:hypothetical protein Tco_0403972 [Tanacetum coccineum]